MGLFYEPFMVKCAILIAIVLLQSIGSLWKDKADKTTAAKIFFAAVLIYGFSRLRTERPKQTTTRYAGVKAKQQKISQVVLISLIKT